MALARIASFKPVIRLLLESSASDIPVQTWDERWWYTTHTFHIANRGITVTSHDFHQMIGLRCDGPFIDLEGKSGTQLSIYLLGYKYLSKSICYFDLEPNYRLYSQATHDDCA